MSCFWGHWPFHKLYKNTLQDLQKIHEEHGITSGYVSSLNSIFYNDPYEGDEELHEAIKDEPEYLHVLTINPTLPSFRDDIEHGVRKLAAKAVRIYPGYHRYKLHDEHMHELCDCLNKYDLPLFLTLRMEDERLNYLLEPETINLEELQKFLEQNVHQEILLSNIRYAELMELKKTILSQPHVIFDTTGLKDLMFIIEKMIEMFPAEKIRFGSLYPLHCFKSTWLLVDKAEILNEQKQTILRRQLF